MRSKPRIAISLGASFIGYATHAGFLARLHSLGIRPVAIGGASAGAITAGLYAAGLETEEIKRVVLGRKLLFSFISHTRWIWHQFVDIYWHRHPGFFDPRAAIKYFESLVGSRDIDSLVQPRLLIALSDLHREETIFATHGPLATAMAASACVPTLFSPIMFNGRPCTDGGVAHEMPIEPWLKDDDIDLLVLHRITPPEGRPPWFLTGRLMATIAASHQTMNKQIMADREELARLHHKKLIRATTYHPRPSPFFTGRLVDCYQMGEETAQRLFDEELKALL